jgi:hypothetical protein
VTLLPDMMDAVAAGADMPRSSSEMGVWLVAHLVRDEGVAGSNPATPTSFLVAPIRLRGQLCGTKHTSDNLAPPIPIHSAPSGGGAGVGIWKRCHMSIANCSEWRASDVGWPGKLVIYDCFLLRWTAAH